MSEMTHQTYTEDGVEVVELRSADTILKIAAGLGNTLYSLQHQGRECLYFPGSLGDYRTSDRLGGNPFMHPWANRLEGDHIRVDGRRHDFPDAQKHLLYRDGNGLPLHGLLLKTDQWQTVAVTHSQDFIYHHATLDFDRPDWLRIFPFPHTLEMKTYLHAQEVCIEVVVYNSGQSPLPLSFGFHPYFRMDPSCPEQLRLTIPLREVLDTDALQIPNGERQAKENLWPFERDELSLDGHRLDHAFAGQDRKRFFRVEQQGEGFDLFLDNDYRYVQVYAPNRPDKPYVCVEPMLAPANALNSGACAFLEPGKKCTQAFSICFDETYPDA